MIDLTSIRYNNCTRRFSGPLPPPISGSSPTEPLIPTVTPPLHQSAFRPVIRGPPIVEPAVIPERPADVSQKEDNSDDEVDIETTEDDPVTPLNASLQNLHSASNSAMSSHSGRSTSPQCWSPPRETVSSDLESLSEGLSGGL